MVWHLFKHGYNLKPVGKVHLEDRDKDTKLTLRSKLRMEVAWNKHVAMNNEQLYIPDVWCEE